VNYSRKNPKGFFENAVMPVVKTYPQLKGANLISLEKDLKSGASLALLQINPALIKMSGPMQKILLHQMLTLLIIQPMERLLLTGLRRLA
jgi:hypothetical protein